jgi:ferrous iron transport protein B
MGLTSDSTGKKAADSGLVIQKMTPNDQIIALAGNPNVGKSTVFNELTGLNQHTGNWPGKTVTNAQGTYTYHDRNYILVDLPGTYSLLAHSTEEEVARDFICFGQSDVVVVVCDATCLERNLNLVLQTMEITSRVIVCINLMDEAKKKQIRIDKALLEEQLGVPVVTTSARSRDGLNELMETIEKVCSGEICPTPHLARYLPQIAQAAKKIQPVVEESCQEMRLPSQWVSLRLLDCDIALEENLYQHLKPQQADVHSAVEEAREFLQQQNIPREAIQDKIVSCLVLHAEGICNDAVIFEQADCHHRDRKLDKILTSRLTGIPIMILLLLGIFWLTITGANYPSELLSMGLFWIEDRLTDFFVWLGTPDWVHGVLVLGIYRVVAWVVSVMLPPMAIFFPLFTLLEDFGYLPRVAFNLDHFFQKARACGKQALTMCMGFGCNAAGIVGCRIIDSPRERLIAMITNNFVPCNGRFPTLISIISMFFVGMVAAPWDSVVSTCILTAVILLGVFLTFFVSRLLSLTILKGIPSSFTLELPPYRKPQIGKILVRSIFDRTLFVLGRAVSVAAPAGLIIWLMANITIGDMSLLAHCADFLDPFAHLFGLDGVILLAFILGFPANEIVVPIIIMAYMATGSIMELSSLSELKTLLVDNGWTWLTAVCTMLFCLMHWPCSTTCMTIRKETKSLKWTAISFAVPTGFGLLICFIVANTARLIGVA